MSANNRQNYKWIPKNQINRNEFENSFHPQIKATWTTEFFYFLSSSANKNENFLSQHEVKERKRIPISAIYFKATTKNWFKIGKFSIMDHLTWQKISQSSTIMIVLGHRCDFKITEAVREKCRVCLAATLQQFKKGHNLVSRSKKAKGLGSLFYFCQHRKCLR